MLSEYFSMLGKFFSFIFKAFILLFLLNACGGESDENQSLVQAQVQPSQVLVVSAPRPIPFETANTIFTKTYDPPSTQFRLEIDNKEGTQPVTILLATMRVTGPKGQQFAYLNPSDIFTVKSNGNLLISTRGYIAEIGAGRKSSCMHKVDYLELASTGASCPSDLSQDPNNTALCCPTGASNLSNTTAILGPIQRGMSQEELNNISNVYFVYTFQVTLIGWTGTFLNPIANFRQTFQFQSSGF